ncbi:amidase [Chenggangzhangella methanolivorans]|uniref:amidase n=1 Tax=Chenggangzhangella methanolivorans TaxID=1437009 RepID=UPI003613A406
MLAKLGLREAVSGLNEGRFALSDYVGALYDRARRLDGEVKAFGWLPEAGGAGEASPAAGPFAGVPVGIKDLIDVGGVPTTYGSAGFADHRPERDAWAVARLKSLGASVFGKTVTTEFAWRDPGATRNPWSLGHTPGGSSSGSAAAVAAGFVPLALGTQTFGSVVRPAAYCGVVGFKPSFGAIPRTGAHPLSPSLDHIGVFARNVGDAAFAIGRLAAVSDEDEDGRDIPGLPQALAERDGPPSIGLLRTADWDLADREQRDLLEKVAADLAAAGARVDELTPPDAFAEIPAGARVLLAAEAADVFSRLIAERPGAVGPAIRELVADGARIPAQRYVEEKRRRSRLRRAAAAWIGDRDAVLTLAATGVAPKGLAFTGDPRFCVPWTYLGLPALALPAGDGSGGLPLAVQLVGRDLDDANLLRTAAWCERVVGRPMRLAEPA